MTLLTKNPIFNDKAIDLLVGGTPCQSFSVAGLRHGLDDSRGNLSLEFVRILITKQPQWFVWENVPGVLSSAAGADFASILSAFTGKTITPQKFAKGGVIQGDPTSENGAGYSIAYRVLDSQYFGVPQRRRRVFVIGHLGADWRPPTAVLFERESLYRDFTPSREPRQKATGTTPISFGGQSGKNLNEGIRQIPHAAPHMFMVRGGCEGGGKGYLGQDELTYTLSTKHDQDVVYVFDETQITCPVNASNPKPNECHTLPKNGRPPTMFLPIIRRLTPRECERLQGFPDDYTLIPKAPNGSRYKALGNSMTTNVMKWIGTRIEAVNTLLDVL